MKPTSEIRKAGNHLVGEPSPYLEQHAHNPVDWYPWGPEAIARAQVENKLIFLSVGYATCHWCHVMEHESFEDDTIAQYLNEHFVSIKVDREQRPDVDELYMRSVAAMGQSTGWPLSVFLTPKLEPVFGGTYFPPRAKYGRIGFLELLQLVVKQWHDDPSVLTDQGRNLLDFVRRLAEPDTSSASMPHAIALSADGASQLIAGADAFLERIRDWDEGGFGSSQKFPNAPLLFAELRFAERTGNERAREHLVLTLDAMVRGGLRDHLTGTFHRYAVDPYWHVPHFEKMLYDNAQLALLYVEAGAALDRADFTRAGRDVFDELIAAWQQPDGGLIVGFDADDPGGEGYYYTWTPEELRRVLGDDDGDAFAKLFGVRPEGERELEGRSVLHRIPSHELASTGLDIAAAEALCERAFPKMLVERGRRTPPSTDDKELTCWNGLALMAFSEASQRFDEPRYREAAQRIGAFLAEQCWSSRDAAMVRGRRRGVSLGQGFLDDYALSGLGFLRLHSATGALQWLELAHAVAEATITRFWSEPNGSFIHAPRGAGIDALPLERFDHDDGVLPGGGNAAILLMLELGAISGDMRFLDLGHRALAFAVGELSRNAFSTGFLATVLDHAAFEHREVVIVGELDDPRTRRLWDEVRQRTRARLLPARLPSAGLPSALAAKFPALAEKATLSGRPTAYVCSLGRCEAPTSDPAELRAQLSA